MNTYVYKGKELAHWPPVFPQLLRGISYHCFKLNESTRLNNKFFLYNHDIRATWLLNPLNIHTKLVRFVFLRTLIGIMLGVPQSTSPAFNQEDSNIMKHYINGIIYSIRYLRPLQTWMRELTLLDFACTTCVYSRKKICGCMLRLTSKS